MDNNNNFTNEEIWNFLKNKMKKNGLTSKASIVNTHIGDYPNNEVEIIKAYYKSDVVNAIAIAYRSGYLRAMKGRPFKIGEKKKKDGHWEPIDPNTRVRYSRLTCDDNERYSFSDWSKIQIGEETVVMYWNDLFGVKDIHNVYPNTKYISSCVHPERFDMWVEDSE